jgi:hypothetical protein
LLLTLFLAPITKDLLRAIRNDLPMKLTIERLREHGPIKKQVDGNFRFQRPSCGELRATGKPTINELTDELWEKASAMLA